MDALKRRPRKEAELHHKPENGCEYNGEGSPRRCGAQALPHNFDEDDKDIESEHQQKAIRDEDACDAGCGDENVLEVKGRKERADTEDDEKKEKLEDRKDGFFHG
jgi:hypothetical protein